MRRLPQGSNSPVGLVVARLVFRDDGRIGAKWHFGPADGGKKGNLGPSFFAIEAK
jgi:hypothetical protein